MSARAADVDAPEDLSPFVLEAQSVAFLRAFYVWGDFQGALSRGDYLTEF